MAAPPVMGPMTPTLKAVPEAPEFSSVLVSPVLSALLLSPPQAARLSAMVKARASASNFFFIL